MSDFKLELGTEEKTSSELNTASENNAGNNIIESAKEEDTSLSISSLSESERQMVMEFSQKIDINNNDIVSQFGAVAQNKVAKFSDNVLRNVRTKDAGAIGGDLSQLVAELQNYDPTEEEKTGIRKLFSTKNAKKKMDQMVAEFSKVETNVDKIVGTLETHQRQLIKDVTMLDELYKNNYEYYKELSLYIIAGNQRLEEFKNIDIPKQREIAEKSNNQMEAQKLNDMINQASRFEKRLHDLKLSRTISIQMAPQIRLIQNNDTVLVEKIQSSILNSIPLWKNQMVIALGIANSQAALDAQRRVTDMTNELLLKNSEMLKQGSIDVAKEAERSIVSIDTLRKTNDNLITTITEVLDIQRQGSEERAAAEVELQNIENEIKQVLLESSGRNIEN